MAVIKRKGRKKRRQDTMVLRDSKPKRPQSGRMQKTIVPEVVTFKTFIIQRLVKA